MNLFNLNHDENYDKICGEIFVTTKGRLAYYCTFCGKFLDHESFIDHLLKDCFQFMDNDCFKGTYMKREKHLDGAPPYKHLSVSSSNGLQNIKRPKNKSSPTKTMLALRHKSKILQSQVQDHLEEVSLESIYQNDEKTDLELLEQEQTLTDEVLEEYINIECLGYEEINQESQSNYQTEQNQEIEMEEQYVCNAEQCHEVEDTESGYILEEKEYININDQEIDMPDNTLIGINYEEIDIPHEEVTSKENSRSRIDTSKVPVVVRNVRARQKYIATNIAPEKEERKYKCRICGLAFKDSANMNYHIRRHTDKKPYSCPDCDKKFFTSTEVKSHSRVHYKLSKNFLCTDCGMAFETNYNLTLHQKKAHTNQRDYVCQICNKAFFILKQLKRHMASHSSERPYSCKLCAAKFKLPNGLRTHMKQHANKREYQCHYCEAAYNVKAALNSHLKSKHKELT